MSHGALPRIRSSHTTFLGQKTDDLSVQNSSSELFELKPKPKLVCIPEDCRRIFNDLRKTQSLNVPKKMEQSEKSWSVIFLGSKGQDGVGHENIIL